MLQEAQLKHVVHLENRSQRDAVLLILSVDVAAPKSPEAIRTLGRQVGIRGIDKWNIPDVLGKAATLVAKVPAGWELTASGKTYVRELVASAQINLVVTDASHTLRKHLPTLAAVDTRAFVEEAIVCFEAHQYRAAVVLSWVGAISVLHQHVAAKHLMTFNTEATKRDQKWRPAKNTDDLGRLKEHEFLEVIEAIGVIGKNVKQLLQTQLQLRNSCGHPNTAKIAENSVAAHIEVLVLNVFTKF